MLVGEIALGLAAISAGGRRVRALDWFGAGTFLVGQVILRMLGVDAPAVARVDEEGPMPGRDPGRRSPWLSAHGRPRAESDRWRLLALFVLLVGFWTAAVPSVALSADTGEARTCTRDSGQATPGSALKPAVKLVPDNPAEVVNFAGSGGREFVDVVLNATPALPRSLQSNQIRVGVLRRFTRSSETLRREAAPAPTFTEPKISPNRDRVTFTVCLDGSGLKAGSYAGSVYIEGPPGLSPTNVSIIENATDSSLALGGTIAALVAAFFFLVLRGAAARQVAAEQTRAEQLAKAAEAKDQAQIDKLSAAKPKPVLGYLGEVFKDLNWVITTLVALGAALGTIIGIYNANPAWGADTLGSLASLVGPAFTAVGVQSVVASLGRSVTKS